MQVETTTPVIYGCKKPFKAGLSHKHLHTGVKNANNTKTVN